MLRQQPNKALKKMGQQQQQQHSRKSASTALSQSMTGYGKIGSIGGVIRVHKASLKCSQKIWVANHPSWQPIDCRAVEFDTSQASVSLLYAYSRCISDSTSNYEICENLCNKVWTQTPGKITCATGMCLR